MRATSTGVGRAEKEAPSRTAKLEGSTLTITVNGKAKAYTVEELSPHPDVGQPAFRLTTPGNDRYDVIVMPEGVVCDCPDFNYRRANLKEPCKHAAALVAVGLLRRTP
jgi:hypothetical protein